MRTRWLQVVLRLTNLVFVRKQRLLERKGFRAVGDVASLLVLEVVLDVVSLPLYVGMRPATVTTFLAERGYTTVAADYRVRRVLTLTGVGVLLVVWIAKLTLIVGIPAWGGPLELYTISPLAPADIAAQAELVAVADIETARVDQMLSVPRITAVARARGGGYVFRGTGIPLTGIALIVANAPAVMLTDRIGSDGTWQITYEQEEAMLIPGNHELAAYHYDAQAQTRSALSSSQYIRITRQWSDVVLAYADTVANWAVIVVLMIGVLLMVLTAAV